jgi:hypothetical protein
MEKRLRTQFFVKKYSNMPYFGDKPTASLIILRISTVMYLLLCITYMYLLYIEWVKIYLVLASEGIG